MAEKSAKKGDIISFLRPYLAVSNHGAPNINFLIDINIMTQPSLRPHMWPSEVLLRRLPLVIIVMLKENPIEWLYSRSHKV